jgi:long-chain acyl-CoA synthetase
MNARLIALAAGPRAALGFAPMISGESRVSLKDHLRQVSEIDGGAVEIYFGDKTYSWTDLRRTADAMNALLDKAGIPAGAPVGWIARNHPAMAAAALGILLGGRSISPLNPLQPAARLGAEIGKLKFGAVVGVDIDWPEIVVEGARESGSVGLAVRLEGAPAALVAGLEQPGAGPFREVGPNVVMERMSSGTTGDPKRIPVTEDVFETSMEMAKRSDKAPTGPDISLKKSPGVQVGPFGHAAGIFHLVMCLYHGRPIVLFEKFDARHWADVVERFGIKAGSLVPSMINMMLEADPPKEKLKSLLCVRSGTAPLDPAAKAEFERRYDIPVLTEYGASEFMGGVAGWTLGDHQKYSKAKPTAAGRLRPDVQAKIIDGETGEDLALGQTGVLVLKSDRWSPDWIRTTDLASLDADGFIYIHGRADEAIIRGGFKILPEKVAEVLRMHPGVRDASVLAIKDARLGQAPLAVVEYFPGGPRPTREELQALVRDNMPAYNVPVAVEVVDELPRTPSLKVARPAVRERFADKYAFAL